MDQHNKTIVIGGGQAGLAVGYHLAKRGVSFQILDANARIGDTWRNRWDSLRLFTPARYNGLPGLPFPMRGDVFPTKDEMADYLEDYAKHFRLPVQTGAKVDKLSHEDGQFIVKAGAHHFQCEQVVVAMANYQKPKLPIFANELDPRIVQLHSHNYRNPSQLQKGGVLIVGVGNSGADIAMEVAKTHPTWLAGKESGSIPYPIESWLGRFVFSRLMRFAGHYIFSLATPIGRKHRPTLLARSAPLIRVKPDDLVKASIERVPKVVGVENGQPLLANGRNLYVMNVIWCTGYQPGFSWIDLPIFGKDGKPKHERGVIPSVPGLYFAGLHFLYAMTSATVTGVGRDAEYIAENIAWRMFAKRTKKVEPIRTAAVA